jgi:hypothetical protein
MTLKNYMMNLKKKTMKDFVDAAIKKQSILIIQKDTNNFALQNALLTQL